MARPDKDDIKANAEYLKEWDDYQRIHDSKKPILLPISVSIEDGIIARDRIKQAVIAKWRDALLEEFDHHCKNPNGYLEDDYCTDDFQIMLDDYINFFKSDGSQGPRPPSPLDFEINRPIWFLFYLPRGNWKFTDAIQFSTENDRDDFGRNFQKITTLQDSNILLLANHCRSSPVDLKYNLHVTIAQDQDGKIVHTDIIIDPGTNNDTRGGNGGENIP
jgi:hypothetical protein